MARLPGLERHRGATQTTPWLCGLTGSGVTAQCLQNGALHWYSSPSPDNTLIAQAPGLSLGQGEPWACAAEMSRRLEPITKEQHVHDTRRGEKLVGAGTLLGREEGQKGQGLSERTSQRIPSQPYFRDSVGHDGGSRQWKALIRLGVRAAPERAVSGCRGWRGAGAQM